MFDTLMLNSWPRWSDSPVQKLISLVGKEPENQVSSPQWMNGFFPCAFRSVYCCLCLKSNSGSEHQPCLESMGRVMESTPTGQSTLQSLPIPPSTGDFNAQVGNNRVTWRGVVRRNSPPDLISVIVTDLCMS